MQRGQITRFQKINLYGYSGNLFLLEFDYGGGSGAAFPWKIQILVDEQGFFLHEFNALSHKFVHVLPGNPFLLITNATSKGNGGHELYKINSEGKVENVYDATLNTYNKHEDMAVYMPNELMVSIKDDNSDGFADLIFTGTQHYIMGKTADGFWYDSIILKKDTISYSPEKPFRKVPVRLVFLYDKPSGHFKQMEDYEAKYEL